MLKASDKVVSKSAKRMEPETLELTMEEDVNWKLSMFMEESC